MKVLIIFFVFLKLCTGFYSVINFTITESDNRFPWMAVIKNSTSPMIAYGAIVHHSAVLTLARMKLNEQSYFDLEVHFDCFSLQTNIFSDHPCSSIRKVNECHIIEDNINDYRKNLAILVLSRPINVYGEIGITHLSTSDNDYSPDYCIILSLRTMMHKVQSLDDGASLFSSVFVHIQNKTDIELILPGDLLMIVDDLHRKESLKTYFNSRYSEMDFAGSPVMCKYAENFKFWLQVGVANLVLRKNNESENLELVGDMIKINNNNIQNVFEEIIKESTSLVEMMKKYIRP